MGTAKHAYCAERSALSEGGLVSDGILVVFIPLAVARNNENTKDVGHDDLVVVVRRVARTEVETTGGEQRRDGFEVL